MVVSGERDRSWGWGRRHEHCLPFEIFASFKKIFNSYNKIGNGKKGRQCRIESWGIFVAAFSSLSWLTISLHL